MWKIEKFYWDYKAIYAETELIKVMGDDPMVNIVTSDNLLVFAALKKCIENFSLEEREKINYLCVQG